MDTELEANRKEIDRHDPLIVNGIEKAPLFKKRGTVSAEMAKGGEIIETRLSSGVVETTNTAAEGDFVITNPGGEKYIIKPDVFNKRYKAKDGEESVYEAKGYCRAIKNPYGEDIQMMASWGEVQVGDSECLLADTYDPEAKTLGGEPYIIEKDAFANTYELVAE